LLDTNILSDLVHDPQGRVAQKIKSLGETSVCTSIVVACELRFGARKKNSRRLTEKVEALLRAVPVIPLEADTDQRYAEIRAWLDAKGTKIGANDTLIAAHALELGLTVVTDNEGEFRRVKGLRVENWLESAA
jgi:tRNA(fMet)-specific endonuclease VapC